MSETANGRYPSQDRVPGPFNGQTHTKAKDFVDLHDQVQTSISLLDSLESFLSTFQKDLSAVSGQISELQDRSKHIDNRLKSRRRIEKPLSNLISDICITPSLVTLIVDTHVGEPWIPAIGELEKHLNVLSARGRVKAAKDMAELATELKLVATTKLRAFFMAILKPIKTSMTTNMQVVQTSILLKYRPLFTFLQKYVPNVASEIQRSYVGAARAYYETGFRRYCRSLGWIMARTVEKLESLVNQDPRPEFDTSRLDFARIDGPGVALGYMGDDKTHKEPIEALLRSILLVLMDNATAEYTFITTFFASDPEPTPVSKEVLMSPPITHSLLSPMPDDDEHSAVTPESEQGSFTHQSVVSTIFLPTKVQSVSKEEQNALTATWKQIMDPALGHSQTFIQSLLEPVPATIPLLTMIRLTEDVVNEVQKRGCAPLESFVFSIRLKMWPLFQKVMSDHVDQLKKYAEGGSSAGVSGFFGRGVITTDSSVATICKRYVTIFEAFVTLTVHEEETMIFSNLLRLRQELSKLIIKHTEKITDSVARASSQGNLYQTILRGLSEGPRPSAHPKAQTETAYWREREEESRRRMVSANRPR